MVDEADDDQYLFTDTFKYSSVYLINKPTAQDVPQFLCLLVAGLCLFTTALIVEDFPQLDVNCPDPLAFNLIVTVFSRSLCL